MNTEFQGAAAYMEQNRRSGDRRTKTDRRTKHERRAVSDRRAEAKRRRRNKGIATLILLSIASMMALGLFIVFQTKYGTWIDWQNLFFLKQKETGTFEMGKVSLGMTPEMVREKHPNLNMAIIGRGESIATFTYDGANYTVWFVKLDGRDKAFRMRYDHTFTTITEEEILDRIGDKHGKPGTTECSRNEGEGGKCYFQWWPAGGISLNVNTAKRKPDANAVTDVTMIATDTYLDGKRLRNREASRLSASPDGKKKTEKLPF